MLEISFLRATASHLVEKLLGILTEKPEFIKWFHLSHIFFFFFLCHFSSQLNEDLVPCLPFRSNLRLSYLHQPCYLSITLILTETFALLSLY